jgi:hypothetical protein
MIAAVHEELGVAPPVATAVYVDHCSTFFFSPYSQIDTVLNCFQFRASMRAAAVRYSREWIKY